MGWQLQETITYYQRSEMLEELLRRAYARFSANKTSFVELRRNLAQAAA